MEKEIDPVSWPRRSHYELFRAAAMPHLSLTARVEVGAFRNHARTTGGSLFTGVLYAVMRAANAIPELRTRFRENRIVEHDAVHASYTVPLAGERFGFCETFWLEDWDAFNAAAKTNIAAAAAADELQENTADSDHWIYSSCMPWLDFTSAHHPVANADDCIPRIAWGKITEENGKWHMAVNLQAHHALVDGLHAARFFEKVSETLATFRT